MYSRAQHDFRHCPGGGIFVDGGLEYLRYGGEQFGKAKRHTLDLPITPQELYDDWNSYDPDKFGSIAPCGQPLSSASYALPPTSSGTSGQPQL